MQPLGDRPVSRTLGIPLQEQIRARLAAQIADGTLPPSHRLPSEAELAKTFGVSLSPLRAALSELADAGLIRRARGSGTYVRGTIAAIAVDLLESFSQAMRAEGVAFTIGLTDVSDAAPGAYVAQRLGDPRLERSVHIARVATIDRARSVLLESWLPLPRFTDLLDPTVLKRTQSSLHTALLRYYGVRPAYSERTFAVSAADDALVAMMDVPFGSPVLTIETVGRGADGIVVEFASVRYDATRFTFRLSTPQSCGRSNEPGHHLAASADEQVAT